MAGQKSNGSLAYKSYVRPEWPYEDWTCIERECEREQIETCPSELENEPSAINMPIKEDYRDKADTCNATSHRTAHGMAASGAEGDVLPTVELASENRNEPLQGQVVQYDEGEDFAPNHWACDLTVPLADDLPLCHLLRFMEPELNGVGIDSQEILEEMNKMMRKTSEKLESCYVVFEQCYVIPVGSMAENTKVGKADELDYAIVLPYFENFDELFPIIFQKDESLLYDNPAYVALTSDIASEGYTKEVQENFQSTMKTIWSLYVADFIPEGWELSELNCLGAEQSIARTFHLTRRSDGFIVDIDICFWLPIHKSKLEEEGECFEQNDYLLDNCLDGEMKLYAILPKDRDVEDILNSVRFAMSLKEREELNKYGPKNGRIQCFKLAKCVAQGFMPTIQKEGNCSRCRDRLVTSFALKNIVLFMASNYPDDKMWTEDQLGNRVCEVFSILDFCAKVNCAQVSAFLIPYIIQLEGQWKKYDSAKGVLVSKAILNESCYEENNCLVPGMKRFESLFMEDPISKKILQNYFTFLHESDWCAPEVFDRLNEMLTALREKEDQERKEYAENPGCLCFQPEFFSTQSSRHVSLVVISKLDQCEHFDR